MSPEAIEMPEPMRSYKVGRASDVWSLGCILYQMVYGFPPFHHLNVLQKMRAIPDANFGVEFPTYAVPSVPSPKNANGGSEPPKKLDHLKRKVRIDVIQNMKACLKRQPKERATIPMLLETQWIAMEDRECSRFSFR